MKVTTEACLFGAWAANRIQTILPKSVLDVGAGTGLLSLMLAQSIRAKIIALEPNDNDFKVCKQNFELSPWHTRLLAMPYTLQEFATLKTESFDAIICNPPFFSQSLPSPDPRRNFAMHENELTLLVLLTHAKQLLTPAGKLFLLLPAHREAELFEKCDGFAIDEIMRVKQTTSHQAFRIMVSLSPRKTQSLSENVMEIKDRNNVYTESFTELLKNYYLRL